MRRSSNDGRAKGKSAKKALRGLSKGKGILLSGEGVRKMFLLCDGLPRRDAREVCRLPLS